MWLKRGRYKKERDMVESMIADGQDPIEIAAAALKLARNEEKQRPISAITQLSESRDRSTERSYDRSSDRSSDRTSERSYSHDNRPRRTQSAPRSSGGGSGRNSSNEAGMVRLNLNAGKQQGIRPNDIVGAIAFHADIPGYTIGKILIQDQHTLVDVPEEFAGKVLGKSNEIQIRKLPIIVQYA